MQIRLIQEGAQPAAAAGHGSASSRGFAGAVSPIDQPESRNEQLRCLLLRQYNFSRQRYSKDDSPMAEEASWELRLVDAAYGFGLRCAELVTENPYNYDAPLDGLINSLMTELWDRNFSQTEIRAAFEAAIKDMPRYAAGEERRSLHSSRLFTTELRVVGKS
jgi:hypothetical protein